MPTSQAIFDDMRQTISETLLLDWNSYMSTIKTAYDTAYNSIKTKLGEIQARQIERSKAQQELMLGALSIVTGGFVGVFADGLVAKIPKTIETLETKVILMEDVAIEVTKAARKDSVLFKVLKDTTKDVVTKGADKLTEIGLDQFKGEAPPSGFSPVGLSVASYSNVLLQGITARTKALLIFARILDRNADAFAADQAEAMRKGMYGNEFFTVPKLQVNGDQLANKAELALWCAWALPRDVKYWTDVDAITSNPAAAGMGLPNSEAFDFAEVRDWLVDQGVPEDAVTVNGYKRGFWGPKAAKGLDVIGFMNWVKKGDVMHTMYEGIPVAGGATRHWGWQRLQEVLRLSDTAA